MRSSCYESAVGTPGGVSAQQDNGVHIGTHPVQGPGDAEALPSRIQSLRFLGPVGIPLGQIMGDQRPFQGRAEGHGDKLALVMCIPPQSDPAQSLLLFVLGAQQTGAGD